MNVKQYFTRWFWTTVALPLLAILVVVNLCVALHVTREINRSLEGYNDAVAFALEGFLEHAAHDLQILANRPEVKEYNKKVESERRQREDEPRLKDAELIESSWANIKSDNLVLKEIQDNLATKQITNWVGRFSYVDRVIMTDGLGVICAASDIPPHYDYSKTEWIKLSKETPPNDNLGTGTPFSLGFTDTGELGMGLPIISHWVKDSYGSTLYAEYKVENFMNALHCAVPKDGQITVLMGATPRFLKGHFNKFEQTVGKIQTLDLEGREGAGWIGNCHYEVRTINGDIIWQQPLKVLTYRFESRFPFEKMKTLYLSLMASVAAYLIILYVAFLNGPRTLYSRLKQVHEAGAWAIQRASEAQTEVFQFETKVFEIPELMPKNFTGITDDLEKWLVVTKTEIRQAQAGHDDEVSKDLELAHDFQMAYLNRPYPKVPAVHMKGRPRLDFYHRYNPALALGGDFFNILPLGPDCACVLIADVMGHGTRSALITSILRTLMSDLSHQGRNARHFLQEMNKQFESLLRTIPDPLFASAFYFVADLTARAGTYASAGHPAPFHLRRAAGKVTMLKIPEPRGAALGVIPDEEYSGGHCRLIPGDVFIFYTDGTYEMMNQRGEEFGLDRLEDMIRSLAFKPLKQIVDGIVDSLYVFADKEAPADDICVVALEVTTASPEEVKQGATSGLSMHSARATGGPNRDSSIDSPLGSRHRASGGLEPEDPGATRDAAHTLDTRLTEDDEKEAAELSQILMAEESPPTPPKKKPTPAAAVEETPFAEIERQHALAEAKAEAEADIDILAGSSDDDDLLSSLIDGEDELMEESIMMDAEIAAADPSIFDNELDEDGIAARTAAAERTVNQLLTQEANLAQAPVAPQAPVPKPPPPQAPPVVPLQALPPVTDEIALDEIELDEDETRSAISELDIEGLKNEENEV